jgi:hypothetical protein
MIAPAVEMRKPLHGALAAAAILDKSDDGICALLLLF